MPSKPSTPDRRPQLAGLAAGLLTAILMLATEPALAIAWDEGYTLGRLDRARSWFAALAGPDAFAARWKPPALESIQDDRPPPPPSRFDTRAELFTAPVLAWFWPFAREEPHGHPPFYAIAALLGDLLTPWRLPLGRARLGTMLAFSLAAGAVCAAAWRRWGAWPAIAATAALVLQPRLFAEAHYATYDALLTSLWIGCLITFAAALENPARRRWTAAFGLLLGCALDTKLTGWFIPIPLLAWIILDRLSNRSRAASPHTRAALRTLLLGGLIALLTAYLFNPPWWPDPLGGLRRFFASNLTRAETINIQTLFLGQIYATPAESLPPYNTLVWLVFVTPIGFLALALVGTGRVANDAIRGRGDILPALAFLSAGFLLTLRALPHTPGHDGVRQFLPAFGCLSILVAPGVAWLIERRPRPGRILAGAAIAEGILSVAIMMPVPLSYYSPIVLGLPGAARLGMEPTYYWDALTADALDWLNRRTPTDRTIAFATNPTSWFYLRQTGQLRRGIFPFDSDSGPPQWYVLQNRPGAWKPADHALVHGPGTRHVLSSKLGVPLVWAFPFDAYYRASLDAAGPPL